jgi:hypothetical protein
VAVESTTTNKDFVVKQGIRVATGVTFPDNTVQTTAFTGTSISVGNTFPASPSEGQLFLYSITERVYYYLNNQWNAIATTEDSRELQDHIHDNLPDGGGLVVSTFIDGGFYNKSGILIDGGSYNTSSFESIYDGGIASDIFSNFIDGGFYNSTGSLISGGFYYTEEFDAVFDSGLAA